MQTTHIGASIVFLSGVVFTLDTHLGEILFDKFFKLNSGGWEKGLFEDR